MAKKEKIKEGKNTEEKIEEIHCGYIAPISEIAGLNSGYWLKLKNIIQEVIDELNIELEKNKKKLIFRMVSDNDKSDIIQESIVKSLYYDKVVICNISYRNPNVLFELGMRIAFNKSVIMIFDNMEKCPFDISGIRYITYDKNLDYYDIKNFKESLKEKIKETLNSKEEGNPYLRVLKDEVLFEVTPQKKEVSEGEKLLLDKISKIEEKLFINNQTEKIRNNLIIDFDGDFAGNYAVNLIELKQYIKSNPQLVEMLKKSSEKEYIEKTLNIINIKFPGRPETLLRTAIADIYKKLKEELDN